MVEPSSGTAELPDVALHYSVWGSAGPWLTMVHGGMMPSVGWTEQAQRLADVARVLTYDQRGYGASSTLSSEFSIPQLARDTLALWDALGIDRSFVAGFSLGGFVAVEAALQAPHRVQGLLLAGTAAGLDPPVQEGFRLRAAQLADHGVEHGLEQATDRVFGSRFRQDHPEALRDYRAVVAQNDSRCLAGIFSALSEYDRREEVSRITCPTIIVVGSDDEAIPPESSTQLHGAIAGSALHVAEGVGHTVHMEDPDLFSRLLRDLVATPT